MAVPITSELLVADLMPVASHDTSPGDTLDEVEPHTPGGKRQTGRVRVHVHLEALTSV